MKLLTRTNTYYILFAVITYIIIAGTFYVVVEHMIYQEVEERLKVERRDFESFTSQHGIWNNSCYFVENKIELSHTPDTLTRISVFKDTLLYNRYSGELVPFREHSFYTTIGPDLFKVSIRKSLIETRKLLTFITATMLVLLCLGLLLLFVFQRKTSKILWKPFYETLTKAKSFELNQGQGLSLLKEDIFEFDELNSVLAKMTDKISRDYQNLKEFTENAAHEIQTPLALIYGRVEELIQGKNFTHEQMEWIQSIHQATTRLSKLHHAILLLSKIENGQFYEHDRINFTELVDNKIAEFDELFTLRNIKVLRTWKHPFFAEMNATLADVLITNLINNAIRHNIPDGTIEIVISHNKLTIANTGLPLTVAPDRLFERFKKQNQSSGSLGLGLAIVKKIGENFSLDISYTVKENFHVITVEKQS